MKIQILIIAALVVNCCFARTVQEITKELKDKKNEWVKLQKENPGCVLEDNSKQQQAIVKRAGVKGNRNYFGSKQTQYVRDSFYCTFCKHDSAFDTGMGRVGPCCKKGANAYNVWRSQRKNVAVTKEYNDKIDVVMKEVSDLEEELKEEVKRQKEEQQKKNIEQAEKRKAAKLANKKVK